MANNGRTIFQNLSSIMGIGKPDAVGDNQFLSNTLPGNEVLFATNDKAEYEKNFMEPGTLKNRIVRYVKMNLGKGDAYGKLQRLLSEHKFVNIQEADKMKGWDKMNTITL